MISYVESEIFRPGDLYLLNWAEKFVKNVPQRDLSGRYIRCHELARAFAIRTNDMECVRDGYFCTSVEHTWLELCKGTILDLYTPGRVPQVQLVHVRGQTNNNYRPNGGGPPFRDLEVQVRDEVINWILSL